jgi:hypothetical protein
VKNGETEEGGEFRKWLNLQRDRQDRVGDFAREMFSFRLPQLLTPETLYDHMYWNWNDVCDGEMYEVSKQAISEYRSAQAVTAKPAEEIF